MALTLDDIKKFHDTAYTNNQTTRIQAADDLLFSRVTQWDQSLLADSQLGYKGEFNIVRKATREIMADLRTNQVQIEFEPKVDDARSEDAEVLNGLYLSSDRENNTIEAYDNAAQECVDCGLGGWERRAIYESDASGERHQKIIAMPLFEFNNNCFPDPNAKLLDKSDAKFWSLLEPFSADGYKALVKELTGKDWKPDEPANLSSFAMPENSYVFPWVTGNELYYVSRFYYREQVKDKILTFTDPLGNVVRYRESDLYGRGENEDVDLMDDLLAQGYKKIAEKRVKRWQVMLYIASGEEILASYPIPGEYIPVVPFYGERAFVEGEEHYEGAVRLAKDPQRLRNFMLSYVGDIASRSPREKPVLYPEQIAGYQNMYDINGAENNFPYVLQNRLAPDGTPLPVGPIGMLPAPQLPPSVAALVQLTREAVEDVANPGLPKDILDSDMSGAALDKLHARLDNQSQVYQDHKKHARRYDAMVFASMAAQVYDTPRKVTTTLPDGSRKQIDMMTSVLDRETGEMVVLNDVTGLEVNVFATLGPTYNSSREKTFDRLGAMATAIGQYDAGFAKLLIMQQMTLIDGIGVADIREYARKQLLIAGVIQPETDEDKAFLQQQAQQKQQPSADMILAQGEMLKGQAAVMKEQRETQNNANEDRRDNIKLAIDAKNAETKAQEVMIKAAVTGSQIHLNRAKTAGQHVTNVTALIAPLRAKAGARAGM